MDPRRLAIGLYSAICLIGVACSSEPAADDANESTGGTAAGGTHSQAGTAGAASGGSPGAGSSGAGSPGTGGTAAAGEGSGGGGGEQEAGAGGVPGQGGVPGAGGEGVQGGAGTGGSAPDDPRPECEVVGKIELEDLRVVQEGVPGGQAELRVDVHNGSEEFVDYNGVTVECVGDAVEFANAQLGVFGMLPGDSIVVTIFVTFTDEAMAGDIASCTVRASDLTAPDDCANAETLQLDVTVQ